MGWTNLVLQYNARQHLETSIHAKKLQWQVKRKINQRKSRVIRQGENEWMMDFRRKYWDLHDNIHNKHHSYTHVHMGSTTPTSLTSYTWPAYERQ